MARQPTTLEIGPGPLSPMVKEANVIVLTFERFYFSLDEVIQFSKVALDFGRNIEVQRSSPV